MKPEARYIAGPDDPVYISPNWPGSSVPMGTPLPAGSTVATIVVESNNGWDPTQAVEFIQTAAEAQKQAAAVGVQVPGGINFAALAQSVGSGAALGALGGGVGAIIGAIVGLGAYVAQWLGGQNSSSTYVNPTVHAFATAYVPQDFIEYALANQLNGWTNVPDMVKGLMMWWVEQSKLVIVNGSAQGTAYSGIPDGHYINQIGPEAAAALYKQYGVDFYATREGREAAGTTGHSLVMQYKSLANVPGDDGAGDGGGGSESGAGIVPVLAVAAVAYAVSEMT